MEETTQASEKTTPQSLLKAPQKLLKHTIPNTQTLRVIYRYMYICAVKKLYSTIKYKLELNWQIYPMVSRTVTLYHSA